MEQGLIREARRPAMSSVRDPSVNTLHRPTTVQPLGTSKAAYVNSRLTSWSRIVKQSPVHTSGRSPSLNHSARAISVPQCVLRCEQLDQSYALRQPLRVYRFPNGGSGNVLGDFVGIAALIAHRIVGRHREEVAGAAVESGDGIARHIAHVQALAVGLQIGS